MSQPSNVNLDWEKTITYDLGIDFSAFKERLKLTVDYYYKRTSDMLFSSDLPAYTGYSTQYQNIADMQNQGIEIQVISDNIVRKDFTWQTILNVSHNSNKILKLNFEGNQLDQANSSFKYYAVGYPMAQWYLHEWVGVDPMTGDPLWRLADGTGSLPFLRPRTTIHRPKTKKSAVRPNRNFTAVSQTFLPIKGLN